MSGGRREKVEKRRQAMKGEDVCANALQVNFQNREIREKKNLPCVLLQYPVRTIDRDDSCVESKQIQEGLV